jgi:hypothetical protein
MRGIAGGDALEVVPQDLIAAGAFVDWVFPYVVVPAITSHFHSTTPLPEMRHNFLGEQRHRLLHKRGVHQPSLVEIADELVETILRASTARSP